MCFVRGVERRGEQKLGEIDDPACYTRRQNRGVHLRPLPCSVHCHCQRARRKMRCGAYAWRGKDEFSKNNSTNILGKKGFVLPGCDNVALRSLAGATFGSLQTWDVLYSNKYRNLEATATATCPVQYCKFIVLTLLNELNLTLNWASRNQIRNFTFRIFLAGERPL